jgi:hypothetical protein
MLELLACLTMLSVVLILVVVVAKRRRNEILRRIRPMTDDEFLANCTPGTRRDVALKVRRIVADSLGVPHDRIHPSTRFTDDFGTD